MEEKKILPVVTSATKKKSKTNEFLRLFLPEDVDSVKDYLKKETVNAIKTLASTLIKGGSDMILWGSTTANKPSGSAGKVSYSSYYEGGSRFSQSQTDKSKQPIRYSYDEVVLDTRGEAEEVLARMSELIDAYDVVTVADMYDLCNITGEYTDNNYGWTNLSGAKPTLITGGRYILKLPRPKPIQK